MVCFEFIVFFADIITLIVQFKVIRWSGVVYEIINVVLN